MMPQPLPSFSNLFIEKLVSIGKTLAASIPTIPFTTEGLANIESLFLSNGFPGNLKNCTEH